MYISPFDLHFSPKYAIIGIMGGIMMDFTRDIQITQILTIYDMTTTSWSRPKPLPRYTNALVYFLEGAVTYYFEAETLTAKSGDVLILPKNIVYSGQRVCETNRFIVIDFETAKENELRALRFPTVFPGYPDTAHRFREILRLWEENNMLVCRSRIYALLSTFHGTTSADQRIAGIISVMKQQLGNPDLSLRELCHSFGLSPSHLRRLFHQQTGLSPHQYLEELRITQAKHMLVNGDSSIGEIAEFCGYRSLYYFSRSFKEKVGTSPSEFRNTAL